MQINMLPRCRYIMMLYLLALLPVAHADEIIVNGGFENGFVGWSAPTPNPNPWSVVSGNAHNGLNSAYNPPLQKAATETTLFQTFAPVPVNQIETAGYFYYDTGGPGVVRQAVYFTFSDGISVQDTLFANDPSYQQGQWTYFNWEPFLGSYQNKNLVGIGFFPGGSETQYIDDVSIITVPEPGAFAIAGLAACLYSLSKLGYPRSKFFKAWNFHKR